MVKDIHIINFYSILMQINLYICYSSRIMVFIIKVTLSNPQTYQVLFVDVPPTRWGLLINWQPPFFSPCINLMDMARRARNELFNKLNKVQSNRKSANKLQPLTAVIWLIGQLYKGQYRITVKSWVIKRITANNYIIYVDNETSCSLFLKIFFIFEISAKF